LQATLLGQYFRIVRFCLLSIHVTFQRAILKFIVMNIPNYV
jgi:hypothetical protein